jgi:hypothetical protein
MPFYTKMPSSFYQDRLGTNVGKESTLKKRSHVFARATAAMEVATVKGAPIYVNFNNFAGRGYVPGPVGNNRDRTYFRPISVA